MPYTLRKKPACIKGESTILYVCDHSVGRSPKPNSHFCGLSCCLSFEWCGEGELRTPKYENQKSCFFLYLEFRFSEQNDEIQPEEVTRKIVRKKVCIIQISGGEGGIILLPFLQLSWFQSLHS